MLELLKLKVHNIILYPDLEIDFTSLGNLIVITGENRDVSGASNNGCGKSLICDILTDLLFDRTIRGHSQDSFIGDFDKYCWSSVSLVDTEMKYRYLIKKFRNHPLKKDKLIFLKKDEKGKYNLSRKKKIDTYKVIWKEFGINWRTFKNRNYFGQGDNERFLDVTDAKKADIITDIQDLDDLQKCKDKSHISFKECSKKGIELDTSLLSASATLENVERSRVDVELELHDICNQKGKEIEEEKRSAKDLKVKIKYAKVQIKDIREMRSKFSSLKLETEKMNDIIQALDVHNQNAGNLRRDIDIIKSKIIDINEKICTNKEERLSIKEGNIKKCTHCGADLTKSRTKKVQLNILNKIEESKENLKRFRIETKELDKAFLLENKRVKYYRNEEKKIAPLFKKREDVLKKLRIMEKWEAMLGAFKMDYGNKKNRINYLKDEIANIFLGKAFLALLENIKNIKIEKFSLEKERSRVLKEKSKHEIAERAYDLTMRNLFNDFLDQLNYWSNFYLEEMSDNDIEVIFSPSREIKSKKIVDEINAKVMVNNGKPRRFKTFSGGEKGRINVSTQLALFSAEESNIPLIWLDEPLGGVDDEGRDRILELLRKKAEEGTKIVVVSQHSIGSHLGSMLKVVRENNRSEIFLKN